MSIARVFATVNFCSSVEERRENPELLWSTASSLLLYVYFVCDGVVGYKFVKQAHYLAYSFSVTFYLLL